VRDVRRLGRGLAIAGGSLLVVAAPAGTVYGHAELRESVPAADAHLADPPPLISLRFSERVELLDDAVVLLDAGGSRIELGEPTVEGSVVSATVPDVPDGAYVVDWQVVSADGHPVAGAFTFTVGNATPIDPSTLTPPTGTSSSGSAGLIVWRALTYAGFAVVLGTWAFVVFCWGEGRRDRVLALLVIGGAVLAVVATLLRTLTEASVLDASLADLFDLRSGRAWLALIVLAVLALGVAPLLRSRVGQPALVGLWIASAVAVGVAIAYAGHGSGGRVAVGGTLLTVVHVAAASVWVGGLAALMRCLVAVDRPTAWGVATRFSNIALVMVGALAATGILQAFRQLESWSALTGSDYGRALLVKLGIVVLLLVAARLSRLTVNRPSTPETATVASSRLRRTVGVELVLAAAVFGVTGWLAGASPNASATAESSGPVTVTGPDSTGAATASATITPATVGPNGIHVTITEPQGREPDEVTMQIEPVNGQVAPLDVPTYVMPGMAMSDAVTIPFAGQWTLTINARYGDFDAITFELPFTVS
jgi:copper transport protein